MYEFKNKLPIKFTNSEINKIVNLKKFEKNIRNKKYIIKADYNRKFFSITRNLDQLKLLNKYLKEHIPKSQVYVVKIKTNFGFHEKLISNKYKWKISSKKTTKKVMIIIQEKIYGKDITKDFVKQSKNNKIINKLYTLYFNKKLVPDFCTNGNFIKVQNKIFYVDSRWPLFSKKQSKDYMLGKKIILKSMKKQISN